MDVGGATAWRPEAVVSRREMLERLTQRYGPIASISEPDSSARAARFQLHDGLTFGIISSTTEPFCRTCDRARLTADGVLLLCLSAPARHQYPSSAACRRVRGHVTAAAWRRLGVSGGSRRQRAVDGPGTRQLHPHHGAEEGRPPRDAHARGLKKETARPRVWRSEQKTGFPQTSGNPDFFGVRTRRRRLNS